MTQTNSNRKPFRGGVVFYPNKYVVNDEDILASYAEGVTLGGKEAVVFIHPTESNRAKASDSGNASTIPTINLFAEEHRTAKNPCIATEDNSPKAPVGAMIVEQIEIDEEKSKEFSGKTVIVGKWASVLQVDERESPFMTGKGYLEINFGFRMPEMLVEKQHQYEELTQAIKDGRANPLDVEAERAALYKDIIRERQKWFVAVFIKHDQLVEIVDYSTDTLKNFLRYYMETYTKEGMYGGCLLRVRQGDTVISNLCAQCEHQYDFKKGSVADIEGVIENFMKYYGNRILKSVSSNNAYQLELIPIHRLNCGSTGNNKYGSDLSESPMGASKVLKTYVEKRLNEDPVADFRKSKGFLFTNIACRTSRVARGSGKGNFLLSAIHAFSAPQGNIYTIDKNGRSAYKMDNDDFKSKGA